MGSSEVQALACLPSPSHRKSSNLAQTSPGAAPGTCVGRRNTGAPYSKSLCQGEMVPKFPSVGSLLPLLHPSSVPPSHPMIPSHALRCHSYSHSPNSKCITCPLCPLHQKHLCKPSCLYWSLLVPFSLLLLGCPFESPLPPPVSVSSFALS